MKRLRSSDDFDSYNDKTSTKDSNQNRPSRSFYHKSDSIRKGLISPSSSSGRYDRDRSVDDDSRESSRMIRKRPDHDIDGFDRRKGLGLGFDRYSSREGYSGSVGGGGGGGGERGVLRSESFCVARRDFPKGFRSDRERSRREGSVSSWRRFGTGSKEFEENRGSRGVNEERTGSALRSSPKVLRDVRSPSWSRDSGSDQNRVARDGKRDEGRMKSSASKSRSSPSWSKDSGSERSKSVEVAKKSETEVKDTEMEAKSVESKSSSEMEEGELEPEPESIPQVKMEDQNDNEKEGQVKVRTDDVARGPQKETRVEDQVDKAEKDCHKVSVSEGCHDLEKGDEMPNDERNLDSNGNVSEDEVGIVGGDEENREGKNLDEGQEVEGSEDTVSEKLVSFEKETKQQLGFDLEEKVQDVEMEITNMEASADNGGAEVNAEVAKETMCLNAKDKGKSVAVSSAEDANAAEGGAWAEREPRYVTTVGNGDDDDVEGPSTRGFELFSRSPVRRTEKTENSVLNKKTDESLVLEPLDLSLSLPNVLLPIGAARDANQVPGSPSHGGSVQSFSTLRTTSDGFTGSMSFSGSQSFFHNPSCSLTQNSFDMDNNEQSVHSRPIFQGIWQGQGSNDPKLSDAPLYQKMLMNGNGSLQQGISNSQAKHGNSKMSNGIERQLSFHKQFSGGQTRNHDETKSPSHSAGSHDLASNYSFERKRAMRDKHGSNLYRSSSQKEQEQFPIGGADFVDTIISRILSDPIHVMARKFHEMPGQSVACLKESIHEIMSNHPDKLGQLCVVQSALQSRSDLNLDVLLKSHRVQLEILVSLKTGLHEYLQTDSSISSSDLAEIFLNLRCKNLTCRNPLPVDECECKICAKKNGFCSACMCLVCSKFDMASNTCSWVGCDICLHWCHADCALQESYIRNGRSAKEGQGTTEVQFHCVACDRPSEMFGFVKEVFKSFAKDWSAETFCRELQYVKRIFSASKDIRGRRLYEITEQTLLMMANKSGLPEACTHFLRFLNESDSSKLSNASTFGPKDQGNVSNGGIAGPNQDTTWLKHAYAEKSPKLERSSSLLPTFHNDLTSKLPTKLDLQSAQKGPLFDELESIVRIKQAEAEMFQTRANDARRDAENLKRIAVAKNEKIEEEYSSRISKLRLVEAEEMRKQKFEEFQAYERAHREYFSMKMRMESDIKDLLLRMEATKRNLTM